MLFIPALCFIFSSIYAVWKNKTSPHFWKQSVILLAAEYLVSFVIYLLLRHLMAGNNGTLPFLPVLAVCLLPFVVLILKQYASERSRKAASYLQKSAIALTVVFLLEILVCNAKSLSTDYTFHMYQPEHINYTGEVEETDRYLRITGDATLSLYSIPEDARCLTLPLEQEQEKNMLPYYVKLNMRDDNFSEKAVTVQEKKMIGRRTECRLSFQPYVKTRALIIEFTNVNKPVTLKWIKAASCLTFRFHSLRFWLLCAGAMLVIAVIEFAWYRVRFNRGKPLHLICVAVMIALCAGLCTLFVRPDGEPYDYTGTPSTNDPYALVFDAFEKGQVWLDVTPDEGLQEIENVYSRGQRDASGASSLWDYAYFQGKYYCYFGITPVLLYYYPYYWIHHQLPSLSMAVNFFGILSVIFFCLAVLAAIRMYASHPNLLLLLLSIPASALCCGTYYMMDLAGKYQLPMVAGLWSLSLCLLTGIKACMAKRMPVRMLLLFASGAALALCAGARPSMALSAVVLIPLFIGILLNKLQKLTHRLGQAACFLVPLCAGAAGLMWYNQERFGSPFDFGAAYQLTVSDVHANKLRLTHLWGAVCHYFCTAPSHLTTFPFFEPQWGHLNNYQHYVYLEGTIGWLTYPMILVGLLCVYPALANDRIGYRRHISLNARRSFLRLCAGMALLIAWMDFSAGGVNQRYLYDIAPLLLLCSIIAILRICRKPERHLYCYFLLCGAVIANGLLGALFLLEIPDGNLMRHCPELYNTIEEMVMFWQ